MDLQDVATFHSEEQLESETTPKKGELENCSDTKNHLTKNTVNITTKTLQEPIWNPIKNQVCWYNEIVLPNTLCLGEWKFSTPNGIKELLQFQETDVSNDEHSDHSSSEYRR